MKHIKNPEEKAGLTSHLPDTEPAKPIYIEDKWSWSSFYNDSVTRKRFVLGSIAFILLVISFYLGYKAGTTVPGIQTLTSPDDLVTKAPHAESNGTNVHVKVSQKHHLKQKKPPHA